MNYAWNRLKISLIYPYYNYKIGSTVEFDGVYYQPKCDKKKRLFV